MKKNFLILAMFLFAFSMGYAANGNEEFLKANEYYEKNDVVNAEKMFLESIKKGNVRANYNLATIYLNKKEYSKAEKYFLDALKKNNGDSELEKSTLFNLSRLYQITNQNDKAEKYLKMSSKSTNDVSAEIELGTTYFYQKKYDLAEKAYVSALNKIKDKKELSDNVKLNLAAVYREQKKYKEAENTLLSMNDKNSKNSIRAFGILYWKQNNKRKAVEYFKKALDNGDEEMLSNVVKLYGELDEDDKIEEVLRNQYNKQNKYAYGLYGLFILENNGKGAEKMCKTGIQKEDPFSFMCMEEIYKLQGKNNEAQKMSLEYQKRIAKFLEEQSKIVITRDQF